MELNYYLLDVFTSRQFGGNPLAVFPAADGVGSEVMQSIANELNLSETTFLQKARSPSADCTVRIFTPMRELPMAGHPTIGTAYAVIRHALVRPKRRGHLVFDEGVGPIDVEFELSEGRPSDLWMRQPVPEFGMKLERNVIARVLSLDERHIDDEHPVQVVSCGVPVIIVPLRSLQAARNAVVRAGRLERDLRDVGTKEIFVFTLETEASESTVHCRMFAPLLGIPEDPATGSAHGPLGGYMFRYGLSDGARIVGEQGIEMGRPSTVVVRVQSTGTEITDILVGGECAEVGNGTIRIPDPA